LAVAAEKNQFGGFVFGSSEMIGRCGLRRRSHTQLDINLCSPEGDKNALSGKRLRYVKAM
jgi:hypothetical protein